MPSPYLTQASRPVVQATSVANLRTVQSNLFQQGMLARAAQGALFEWDPASRLADNGTSVIKPDDIAVLDPGRWTAVTKSAISELSNFPTVSVVARGTSVAIAANSTVDVLTAQTRLAGRFAQPLVWVQTDPAVGDFGWFGEAPLTDIVHLHFVSIYVGRNTETTEQYRVQIVNRWSTDGLSADVAVTVDWMVLEWAP